MSKAWKRIEDGLPPLDEVVWMYLPDTGQPVIGCREMVDNVSWLWANAHGAFWYDKEAGQWRADCESDEDYQPSHWMYLPKPPVDLSALEPEGRPR